MADVSLQPDQRVEAWAPFAAGYEAVFEPLTDRFARAVFDRLGRIAGSRFLDVGCGPGGAALIASDRGAEVIAIDASEPMVARAQARARAAKMQRFDARIMDAQRLDLADASVEIAYSGFGVVLLPDPITALQQMWRVLVPSGAVAIVTWTEPQHYQLAARLRQAIEDVRGHRPLATGLPAQLRYADADVFAQLLAAAGFAGASIHRLEDDLIAPSPAELRAQLAFAPGMAATLDALGQDREVVLDRFQAVLAADFGDRPITLRAVAHAAIARKAG